MRKSVVLKSIALLLCTVSLLGIVASGAGILCMTEGKLYSRTVDEMLEDQVQVEGREIADFLAKRYANQVLGEMPRDVAEAQGYLYTSTLNNNYLYAILDQDGKLLEGWETPENCTAYTFPVSGKYMHLVSLQSESERFPALQNTISGPQVSQSGEAYVYNAVPSTGAPVYGISITYEGTRSDGINSSMALGSLYYADGSIVCLFTEPHAIPMEPNVTITQLALMDADGLVLYEAASEAGIGYFSTANVPGDCVMFVSTLPSTAPAAETLPETVPETVPETIPETVPETVSETVSETIAETVPETIPETTAPEESVRITDRIPESGSAEVVELDATLVDGQQISHKDDFGMGRIVRKEDGSYAFTSYEHWETETGDIVRILFRDEDGNILFKATGTESFAELRYDSDSHVVFAYAPPAPAETVPETVPETLPPETVPVTVPETVAETEPEPLPLISAEQGMLPTEPVFIDGKPLSEYEVNTTEFYDQETHQRMYAQYVYAGMPELTVVLYLTAESLRYGMLYDVLRVVQSYHSYLLPILGGCLVLFLLGMVYLFFSAGHSRKSEEIRAGLLNRIPLDLYLGCSGLGIPGLLVLAFYGTAYLIEQDTTLAIACCVSLSFLACGLLVGFLFAAAAQFKTPGGFWWRNTLCGHLLRLCIRFLAWAKDAAIHRLLPWCQKTFLALWAFTCRVLKWFFGNAEVFFLWVGTKLGKGIGWLKNLLQRFLSLLPVTWEWLAIGFVMILVLFIAIDSHEPNIIFLAWVVCIAMIVYGAHSFGALMDAAKKIRNGDLHHKVEDKTMLGSFKDFAEELNGVAGVAMLAAQRQLKSERMKTELITNVSHDIKTPLTSIINYVDLLQKPHTEEEGQQYLEVLSRQSQQLKKLIEDLMDMSKASTGNMNVEIGCVDAVESVNQALGEFADKLDKAQIYPVFRHSKDSVPMMADGRLVWRVLSNLLGNAIKYAMPGTRLYIDLMEVESSVVISMKNISREELNIDADELMERFVRGDGSRNTEGSGLGLNIAKSLMELQKGQMQLLVDGDLFKVTLSFPGA